MKHFGFLFAANAIIWAFVIGYAISISRRTEEIVREIMIIKEQIGKKDK